MEKNRLKAADRAIHGWYRFVLAYPPHLVREYLDKFDADPERDPVFDPFSGTATTPVEARLSGFQVVASDANPIAVLANRVKLGWDVDMDRVRAELETVTSEAATYMNVLDLQPQRPLQLSLFDHALPVSSTPANGFDLTDYLDDEARKVLPKGFISEKPLRRVLALRGVIEKRTVPGAIQDFLLLALAHTIVADAGNVAFGPEVYATRPKNDAHVLHHFYGTVRRMIDDMEELAVDDAPTAHVAFDDARSLTALDDLPPIGVVITSPPYPNEKDYTRTTRLENVLLGYIRSRQDLRRLKERLLRSNTRNVFVSDDDDQYIRDIPSIVTLARQIEDRRIELGKTSGFEKLYHRVTALYFGGMYRHLKQLHPYLRPGARCAYVVGDQMSFFRILIPTAKLLADVAIKAGYTVEGIETWRTRFSTTTREHIEENVLILRRP